MSKRASALVSAAVAVLATTQVATAADVEQPYDVNNWYFSITGGINQIFETDYEGDEIGDGEVEFDYGGRGGVALGYYLDDHWRTEIELGFSSTSADEFSPDIGPEFDLDGSLEIFTALAKIDYEMEFGWWRPYLGIGGGVAVLSADDIGPDGSPSSLDGSDAVFAGAVEAGSKFILSDVAEIFTQTQLLILSDADIEGTLETPLVLSSSLGLRFRF